MAAIHLEIIIPIIGGVTVLFILLIFYIWRVRLLFSVHYFSLCVTYLLCTKQVRFGKKDEILPQHSSMDGIIPTESRRRKSGGTLSPHALADIERAQKFRERARCVTAGRPKFKVSRKNRPKELSFNTLENHQFTINGEKITFRRISEDRTSSFSAYTNTDVEFRGGIADLSGGVCVFDEEHSVNSIERVEEEE